MESFQKYDKFSKISQKYIGVCDITSIVHEHKQSSNQITGNQLFTCCVKYKKWMKYCQSMTRLTELD